MVPTPMDLELKVLLVIESDSVDGFDGRGRVGGLCQCHCLAL